MTLRTLQAIRNRLADDQARTGELEVSRVSTVTHHEGAGKSNAVKPRGKQQEKASDRTLSPRSAGPRVVVASIEAPEVAVALQSESDLAKLARPRCPLCKGPTSSLTGGACLTCRRKMDAAMDAEMKRLADDREFQQELEEKVEDLPVRMKRCPSCGAEHCRPFTDLCGAAECDAWAIDGKYRRWDTELEVSIKESIHG